jgi:hypothetical protein
MSFRDVVLEGVRPAEVEALSRLSTNPDYRPDSHVLRRLAAKGWIESYGDANVLTLQGRTVIDSR